MSIDIPHFSYKQIGNIVDQFLSINHHSLSLPIPIEEITESKLKVKIYEEMNLKRDFDIDAFLTSNLSTIFINFNIYQKFENRARFSIAHEVGHLILHGKIFKNMSINSISDLYNLIEGISDEEYGWLEFQAYSFASHLLVPKNLLFTEIKKRMGKVPNLESPEVIAPVVQDLLEVFRVSGDLMLRRLQKEGIVKDDY
jgi:Zn-dependent peptidase ImmA (M78 family)